MATASGTSIPRAGGAGGQFTPPPHRPSAPPASPLPQVPGPYPTFSGDQNASASASAAARALAAGAPNIERVDRLVQSVAANKGLSLTAVDTTVALVDSWIEKNQEKA